VNEPVVVGLIGAGIGASSSPARHEREASLLGLEYSYRLIDLDVLPRGR
jgi:quinate/shikimate dehydrogenase (NAD+)